MKFTEVSRTFCALETISSRIAITKELADLFKQATPSEIQYLCYLSLGLLHPPYEGTQFAIAQKTMSKIVAEVLNLPEEQVTILMHELGDLGSVLDSVKWHGTDDLTVLEVYKSLCVFEELSGTGSQEKKSVHLQELLKQVGPTGGKYIVRIVLGTLRLGFSDMTIIDALSWMETGDKSIRKVLEHAYTVCADIGLIGHMLKKEGVESIKHMKIHVGIPIRPAAAERLPSAQAIIEKLGSCVVEPKLDGFRLQLHVDKTGHTPIIRFFSRNMLDMSNMFPEFVCACQELPVKELIVDGEAIVYDPNTGTYVPFQETVKRRRKHGIEEMVSELPLQLNMFDILYLDGKSLLATEQQERRAILKDLFVRYSSVLLHSTSSHKAKKETEQLSLFSAKVPIELVDTASIRTLEMIQEIHVSTAQELETYFLREIGAGLEGVVVKKPDGLYQAGKRNFNWIKLKYEASSKLLDTLDVVILGYYPGKGKRAQFGIGAFLVGIYNEHTDGFETVAKIGTGLTDPEWHDIKKKCDAHAVKQQPKNVTCPSELIPTVWVAPEIVCEVLADEITISPVHTAGKTKDKLGIALRFPRFVKFRPDKSPTQTTTLKELKSLQ